MSDSLTSIVKRIGAIREALDKINEQQGLISSELVAMTDDLVGLVQEHRAEVSRTIDNIDVAMKAALDKIA